jgi:transcriptional regulator with XRE-family HTH domain
VRTIVGQAGSFGDESLGMLPSASQIRAARGLLGWSRAELASRARVSTKSLQMLEDGSVNPRASTLEALGRAITNGGVLFLAPGAGGGEGVRRAPTIVSVSREG